MSTTDRLRTLSSTQYVVVGGEPVSRNAQTIDLAVGPYATVAEADEIAGFLNRTASGRYLAIRMHRIFTAAEYSAAVADDEVTS